MLTLLALAASCGPGAGLTVPPAANEVRVPDTDPGPGNGPEPEDAAFIDDAPGINVRRLSRGQRDAFLAIINTQSSACNAPHSLAQSLRDDPSCHDSKVVAQFVADALRTGASTSDIRGELPSVEKGLVHQDIDVKGRPVYGAVDARVTVVVFADFECPHCKRESSKLRATIDKANGAARLVFKHFPLGHHTVAKQAAIASEIAHRSGKFWEMHNQIFANQSRLTEAMLTDFAANIGLDSKQFAADLGAQVGKAVVEADREEGDRLQINGTPAVFVDGRLVTSSLFGGTVEGWIADALSRGS